jgi:DNA-binding response OmpR family regulator
MVSTDILPEKLTPAVARGPTVLVVEDQAELREAIQAALGRLGYAVLPAGSGDEALRAVAAHDIDLAVIDMMIPGPSGFQVLRAVKGRSRPAKAVMMSANGAAAHREYALVLGADGFLVKPFPFAELFRVARALCPPAAPPGPVLPGQAR